jgi:ribonucleoside-triphosphate reductase (thioredoxin)
VQDFLSFQLRKEFIDPYRERIPRWGFPMGAGNFLGEQAFITKYSRRKDDGTRERFYECLERVINGMYSLQKDWALTYRLPWDEETAHRSAQEAYERAFAGKWSPPGRGLWCLGTRVVHVKQDSSPLYNCSYLSTENLESMPDPSLPFTRMMDESMMGIGVGFGTEGAGKLVLHEPKGCVPHQVADSREGWCEATGNLLRAFFVPGRRLPIFDYSRVRPAGSPIKGFGGVAPGAAPLVKLHADLVSLLRDRDGQVLTSADIADVMNMIGKAVVSGNVRRSAQIALGSADDEAFLDLKNWEVNPVRMGPDGHGHLSNNSVFAHVGGDYSHLASRIIVNGEPGLFWKDLAQDYGRMADPKDGKDYRISGINPCGEIQLENHGKCCLVETFPTNCTDLKDYLRTLKYAYLYAKSITLLSTKWEETNEVIMRTRRIGTSMSGIAQFAETRSWTELRHWQDRGYQEIRRWDEIYSAWLGIRESIRVTCVKPSGTVSLLFGVTPGVHWPRERGYYIRTVRELKDSPFARAMEDAGYPVEPSVSDPTTTVVISTPVEGPDIRPEYEVSVWEKANLAIQAQRWWADNAVSCTLTFREEEAKEIPALLRALDGQVKSVSLLPIGEKVYPQQPYQRVSKETWDAMRARVKPIDWEALYDNEALPEAAGENYCSNDSCEVPG